MVECRTKCILIGLSYADRHNTDVCDSVAALIVMITCSDFVCINSICCVEQSDWDRSVVLNALSFKSSSVLKCTLVCNKSFIVIINLRSNCWRTLFSAWHSSIVVVLACTVGNIPCTVIRAFVVGNNKTCRKVRDLIHVSITADIDSKFSCRSCCKIIYWIAVVFSAGVNIVVNKRLYLCIRAICTVLIKPSCRAGIAHSGIGEITVSLNSSSKLSIILCAYLAELNTCRICWWERHEHACALSRVRIMCTVGCNAVNTGNPREVTSEAVRTWIVLCTVGNTYRLNIRLINICISVSNLGLTVELIDKCCLPLNVVTVSCGKKVRRLTLASDRCTDLISRNRVVNIWACAACVGSSQRSCVSVKLNITVCICIIRRCGSCACVLISRHIRHIIVKILIGNWNLACILIIEVKITCWILTRSESL